MRPNAARRLAVSVLVLVFVLAASAAVTASTAVPGQFIAKSYTEVLGRMPDQVGWQAAVNYYTSNGCSQATLKAWGRTVYLSSEYGAIGYDSTSKVLTLYRGVLNREPDTSGYVNFRGLLDGGTAFSAVVDAFYDSSEFASLVTAICNQDSYSFGSSPVIDLQVGQQGGFQGTQAALQAALNRGFPSPVELKLAPRAVVRLTSTLIIPGGRTLTTNGSPNHGSYANMGRLVRAAAFDGPMVQLQSGARLSNVWVDGARGVVGYNQNALSVQLLGGSGTTVSQSVISNTSGWSSLQAFGTAENWPCASNTVTDNLITVYSSSHTGFTFTDGLSIGCENATVTSNQIVDATDVFIVLFRSGVAVQRSLVQSNFLLAAGNSAFGALAAETLAFDPTQGQSQMHYDFTGSSISNNTLWSGRGRFDIGLAVGSRPWHGNLTNFGNGITFTGNTSGTQRVTCDVCISVSGMLNATVQSNSLLSTLYDSSPCPVLGGSPASIDVAASTPDGWASGSIQSYVAMPLAECITSPP